MANLKVFRNKIISILANTCTQKVLRTGYLLVPLIIIYACLCFYISWSHIPDRNITAEISALGYCSDSSYCNFRINIDAVGMSEQHKDSICDTYVEIANHPLYARRIELPDSFYQVFKPICLANEKYLEKMKSFYSLNYECGATMSAKLPKEQENETLYTYCSNLTFNYASNPKWKGNGAEKITYGNGLIAFNETYGSGYLRFKSNLFNQVPRLWSRWDITQSNVSLRLKCNNIRCDTISLEFFGASLFSEMYPRPDYINMSRIEFTDSIKINEIISKGLRFHVEFVQLREMAATRIIVLTSILSLALSLIGSIIYKRFLE